MRLRLIGLMAGVLCFSASAFGTYLDLRNSTVGQNGKVIVGAEGWFGFNPQNPLDSWYKINDQQPTGTGVIEPFLSIQGNGSGGTESGFNTDVKNVLDNKRYDNWTHPLLISTLAPVTINGNTYFQFLLDINESDVGTNLSLDELELYTAPTGSISNLATLRAQHSIYNIDTAGACQAGPLATCVNSLYGGVPLPASNGILLDYTDNSGSGSGDMYFYVPTARFATSPAANQYLYLYSQFGAVGAIGVKVKGKYVGGTFVADAGFEEWTALSRTAQVVPEPSEYAAVLLASLGIMLVAKKRSARKI